METETQGTENRTKPAPRSGSVAAVDNVKTCLHQWAKEVETETSGKCVFKIVLYIFMPRWAEPRGIQ